jgi:hypothetical protein
LRNEKKIERTARPFAQKLIKNANQGLEKRIEKKEISFK